MPCALDSSDVHVRTLPVRRRRRLSRFLRRGQLSCAAARVMLPPATDMDLASLGPSAAGPLARH